LSTQAGDSRRNWLNMGLLAAGAALLLWLVSAVAAPLLIAWILAYLLAPSVTWLAAHGVRREWAARLVFLAGAGAVIALLVLLAPPLISQIIHFARALPDALLHLKAQWAPWIHAWLGIDVSGKMEQWGLWLKAQAQEIHPEALAPWAHWGLSAVSGVLDFILGLFKLILIPLFAFYLLADWDRIGRILRERLPRQGREIVIRLIDDMDAIISLYLRGQFTVCLILACLYSLGLFIVGVPFALAIGLLSGALAFIPYAGLLAGFFTAALITLGQFGADWRLPGVLAVFSVVHLFEELYLTPRILGDRLGLHPLVILLALTIAADRFGFTGMVLAIPVTAAGAVLVREADRRYRE